MRDEVAADVREIEEDVKQDYRDTEPGDDTQDKLDALHDLLDDPEVQTALHEKMVETSSSKTL